MPEQIDTETFMRQLEAKSDEELLDALHGSEDHAIDATETAAVARFGHMWKTLYSARYPHQTRYPAEDPTA